MSKISPKKKENTHTNGAKWTKMIDVNISDMQCTIFDMQCTKKNTVESSFVRGVWMFMDFANCISPETAGTWQFACDVLMNCQHFNGTIKPCSYPQNYIPTNQQDFDNQSTNICPWE